MKAFQRLVAAIIIVIAVAGLQISSVKAISSADGLTLTPSEQYVHDQLLATGKADLKVGFPNDSTKQRIRGAFIQQLWATDPDIAKLTNFEIDNAVIEGDIEASGLTIPFNVELQNCTFHGEINLASAVTKQFRIDNSTVEGAVKMGRMVAEGDVALYQSTFNGEVTLFGANIIKNLFARGSQFNAVAPDKDSAFPFELWTAHVGQTTEFNDSVFKGEVKADNAKFDGDMLFENAVFEKPASFQSIHTGNTANFMKAVFNNDVTFLEIPLDLIWSLRVRNLTVRRILVLFRQKILMILTKPLLIKMFHFNMQQWVGHILQRLPLKVLSISKVFKPAMIWILPVPAMII